MARTKKNETVLTLEEKLDQALIPAWEWPYKIPSNWCWIKLSVCCQDYFSGKSPKYSKEQTDYQIIGQQANQRYGIDFSYIKHVTKEFAETQDERFWLRENDVLLNTLGSGTIGRCGIFKGTERLLTDGHLFVFRTAKQYISKLLYYYLTCSEDKIINSANGSTNQKFLSLSIFSSFPIPCPPYKEQKRIVYRIESLFAKLDEAKERAQATLDSFETRKAAILHKAFTGELTVKWRKKHGVTMTDWENTTLSKIVSGFKYGTSEKSEYTNRGMPVLRIPNVGEYHIDFSDIKYLSHHNIDEDSQIHEGDILIIRSNGSRALVGKSVLVPPLDKPYAYASFLIRIKPSPAVRADYLTLYLNSANARAQMFRKAKSSSGINNINSKELGAITLALPSIAEQIEIVRILNTFCFKELQAKEIAELTFEKIEFVKKAVLSRAFRGELGTNDPTEENAIELIKSLLSEKINADKPKPRRIKSTQEVDLIVKTIMQALSDGEKWTPEKLKITTRLEVDEFYDQLKRLIEDGQVTETRENGESYLEANYEN